MRIVSAIFAILLLIGNRLGFAQGFVNLDFEDATLAYDPDYGPNAVYASDALPGWTVTGYSGPTAVLYNTASAGSTSVSILGVTGLPPALDGNYSLLLYGGDTAASASISQTSLVPVGTASILFRAQTGGPLDVHLVSLGGQNIPFFALSSGSNYTLYGGNIPIGMAGQSEQLMFSVLEGENAWNIDDIQFSTQPIPEPSVFGLLALGGLFLGLCRKRKTAS